MNEKTQKNYENGAAVEGRLATLPDHPAVAQSHRMSDQLPAARQLAAEPVGAKGVAGTRWVRSERARWFAWQMAIIVHFSNFPDH